MDERFAEAFVNRRHTVLGRKLKPFSVWHAFVLDLLGSPFAGHVGETIDFRSLFFAVGVCAREYDPGLRCLRKGPLFRLRFFLRHRGWKKREDRHLRAFLAYLRDYRTGPHPDHFADGTGEKSGVPGPLLLVARLMRLGGMTKAEAWNTPYGEAQWLCLALLEAEGRRTNLLNESERRALETAGHIGEGA